MCNWIFLFANTKKSRCLNQIVFKVQLCVCVCGNDVCSDIPIHIITHLTFPFSVAVHVS